MWNQDCSEAAGGISGHSSVRAVLSKRTPLHILPCTVSQLLSARKVGKDGFVICDWELNQVSVVGVVRGFAPFVTNVQYSVDDMTGPPLNVKQWVHEEDSALMSFVSPGAYVKVTGTLCTFSGQRSLLAMCVRRITDLNEITSHMLEVVRAHMQLFGKVFDVNMNVAAASGGSSAEHPEGVLPRGLSTSQSQVLHVIRSCSVHDANISFDDLKTKLDYLSMTDIRTALAFLMNEGHIFSTIDEHHFKSAEH